MRIGFLFNHEGIHQIAHSLPIAAELAVLRPDFKIAIMVSGDAAENEIRRFRDKLPPNVEVTLLEFDSHWLRRVVRLASYVGPLERLAVLRSNLGHFRKLDALVVPEQTSLFLKTRYDLDKLALIYTDHGAGDRAIGFNADRAKFDFQLLPGRKHRDRLEEKGLLRSGRYTIVGYPKFDRFKPPDTITRLFDNDRPTVLYNPHPSPRLSSWFRMGREVLEYFYQSKRYNLIFAPHVMLFKRKVTITIDPPALALTGRIPRKYRTCPHMLIDTSSRALVDMTYTHSADIYLGDVSSQIYEFLINPRPAAFLDPHGADYADDPNFAHWRCGPVARHKHALDSTLEAAQAQHTELYKPIQQELFNYTFDLTGERSALRAAAAIMDFLQLDDQAALPDPKLRPKRPTKNHPTYEAISSSSCVEETNSEKTSYVHDACPTDNGLHPHS